MEKEETVREEADEKRSLLTSVIVGGVGLVSAVFLLNPGLGLFVEIPDNLPVIGNLDEAAAAALLISCLAYFGVDIGGIFGRKKKEETSEVIDVELEE
ncbi:MAG: DUF1232 domain-containing protein [Verrucomicrobiota bacterium]